MKNICARLIPLCLICLMLLSCSTTTYQEPVTFSPPLWLMETTPLPKPPAREMTARQLAQWTRELLMTCAKYKAKLAAIAQWSEEVSQHTQKK